MTGEASCLNILSANIRGLRDWGKRGDMWLNFQKSGMDIICLQETHLIEEYLDTLVKEWNIEFIISGNSSNSRGVAILINNTFEYKIDSINKDKEGRYIILNLTINNSISILIVNVYGHNNDNPTWYENLFKKIENLIKTIP